MAVPPSRTYSAVVMQAVKRELQARLLELAAFERGWKNQGTALEHFCAECVAVNMNPREIVAFWAQEGESK